ncbi:cobalt/nickel transport system ATP-binding protein [Dongia mobilis]|uniref:ABC transporter ATP-binding protein n=1 Tax=Dongia mobilis TaxID=578943 RepID=A0A4R6WQB1_9PROT|nr:ATP-binding cassette domain-containing protein [Dongia mobilis]TDQ80463.1 cobalt/nickel transport system ATP-binding protein [Dongia mobilis]
MKLSFDQVHYRYADGSPALEAVSLDLAARRIALLGCNGAGKTTLLLHMNGSLRPTGGRVRIDGADASYDSAGLTSLRQRVALVLQDPDDQLFAATVAEDVSFGPMNLGLDRAAVAARVAEALAEMDIADLARRATHALSFGQRKRVAIAGALSMRPEILVLDEPTAGLDPLAKRNLLATLDGLAMRGVQIVFSTHDADLAYAFADHLVLLHRGRVLASGASAELGGDAATFAAAGLEAPYLPRLIAALTALHPGLADHRLRTREDLLEILAALPSSGTHSQRRRSS